MDHGPPAGLERLFPDEAAWGFGDELGVRIVGNEADDRLAGRAGGGTPTGGVGHGISRPLTPTPVRATVAGVWPGTGSFDRLAFSRGPFSQREQALAAARKEGADMWMILGGWPRGVLQNARPADLILDDLPTVYGP